MTAAQRKREAAALRRVALQAEANEAHVLAHPELNINGQRHVCGPAIDRHAYPIGFTCNMVAHEAGEDVRRRYEDLLLPRRRRDGDEDPVEEKLWADPNCYSIRVLLVCFAAAMAETGDLT